MKLLILLFFPIILFALNPETIMYTYGEKVLAIVDDGEALWLGTDGGLVRFNKNTELMEFFNKANTNNGLIDNHIRALAIDSLGNLWVGTQYGGVTKFDGENWQNFIPDYSNLPWKDISCISIAPNNDIYVGRGDCLDIYNGESWTSTELGAPYLSHFLFFNIDFESNGNSWIATTHGLYKLQNNELQKIENDTIKFMNSLAIDKNDDIWFGTQYNGLLKYNKENLVVYNTTNSDIPSNNISVYKFDADENLWCIAKRTLWKYGNKHWEGFQPNISLPRNEFSPIDMVMDNSGNLWVSTIGQGLLKYDGSKWNRYKSSNSTLINNFPNLIATDNEGVAWITFCQPHDSVISFDGKDWRVHRREEHDFWLANFNLFYDSDSMQIWKGNGILIEFMLAYNWAGVYSIKNNKHGAHINVDKKGNVWQVSKRGLRKCDGENWILYNKENTPINFSSTSRLAFDDHEKLYVISDVGLIILDGKNWDLITYNFFLEDAFNHRISSINFDELGNLWLGSTSLNSPSTLIHEDELIKYDFNSFIRYNRYNSALPGNPIFDFDFDKESNLWLGTIGGDLIKFDGISEWTIYNSENSGIYDRFDIQSLEIDINDNIWLDVWWGGVEVFNENGVIFTDVKETILHQTPKTFHLFQNYPNPFNPSTTIKYSIPMDSRVTMKIYDILGKEVSILINNEIQTAGWHTVIWNGIDSNNNELASGIYFCRLYFNSEIQTIKLLLTK